MAQPKTLSVSPCEILTAPLGKRESSSYPRISYNFGSSIKKSMTHPLSLIAPLAAAVFLVGCSGYQMGNRADAEQGRRVAAGGIYKIGTPYEIEGEWYYPQEDTHL